MRIVVDDAPPRSRLDRRAVGALAFFIAVITLIAFPGVAGRATVGSPSVGLVPGPPSQGQCRGIVDDPEKLVSMVDQVPTVPCGQPHSSEIILLATLDGPLYPTDPNADPAVLDGADTRCQQAAQTYLNGAAPAVSRIEPLARARVTLPSETQWAWGQRWFSCQVLPATDAFPISWTGSSRLAAVRVPPAPFATCADQVNGTPVSCQLPHVAEQLSWNDHAADGSDGCPAVAARILGTTDPTYGGALAISSHRRQYWKECWVSTTAGAKLTGTLIGHGARPLPLA